MLSYVNIQKPHKWADYLWRNFYPKCQFRNYNAYKAGNSKYFQYHYYSNNQSGELSSGVITERSKSVFTEELPFIRLLCLILRGNASSS